MENTMTKLSRRLFATILIFAPFTVSAAPPPVCKGMSETLCGETSTCTWIGTYTRSDGRVVNGYCRATSTKKSKANIGMGKSSRDVSMLDRASRKGQ
jgi:hypothetical protein